jgi:hypothetical protein
VSARKQQQQQQRPRLRRQAASRTIIYEEDDDGNGEPDPKRASRQAQPPELDTCLEVVTSTLSNSNRAMLRRVFIAEDKLKYVLVGVYPARGY